MDMQAMKKQFDNVIVTVVDECKKENEIVNVLIRDDVFEILESHCKVIYYPLKDEDINGFHVTRTLCGQGCHFVYINTWNTRERQVFTAAHELGHIWDAYSKVKARFSEIDEYAKEASKEDGEEELPEEFVSNKFAAQLLMPYDQFTDAVNEVLQGLKYNGRSISMMNLLRLIASLMDTFLVDYKAVTRRLKEIGRLKPEVFAIMKKYESNPAFGETFDSILKEGGHKRLNQRTEYNRNISNLTDVIRKAEKNGCELLSTIETLKDEFKITTAELSDQDSEVAF